ncbi:serine/threonine-protein kinase [Dokdonella sp.]|uniref:serine/threonine-protein kinase n=1 Tax=Dokdonella sp. TaxID=2291710 RepID=UPI0025C33649|nr:serine/threonine-protein kinase [Dokdonella sp.]MBX3690236.1 serine/threonine protein kinase [Dokdonella sp.]
MTTSEQWRRIAELFDELVELDAGQRHARLQALREVDVELAREVATLLAADDNSHPLLDGDAADALPDIISDERGRSGEGALIGPYRLLRILGEGGMGVVWLAERTDGAYEQRVAVKLLKRGMDSQAILRRFLQERRILARLQHPNIVHLLDGGMSADGRPYYVMDFVEGDSITLHAQQQQLSLAARVELIAKLADAVAHAHTQLIVHRDLKPSNVLVDARGEPRVLDFGIAKLIEESGNQTMTQTGMRVLSPAYAAPEQILGGIIGTATDVYALGLLLCELLVDALPHKRGSGPARLSEDASVEAVRASTLAERLSAERVRELYGALMDPAKLSRRIGGDLDIIIATALQVDPTRRYATATALARDLRNWLRGMPISARADSGWYRMRRFARRHRLGVAAAALVLLSLVGGLGAALWQASVARGEAMRADSERVNAEVQLERTQKVKDFMLTLFREQDPFSRAKAQGRNASQMIADAVSQVDATLSGDPALQASLRRDLGEIQISLGDRAAAVTTLKNAWEQQKTLSGADSSDSADAQAWYATALLQAGDLPQAEALLRSALDRLRITLGPDDLKTVDAETSLARVDMMQSRNEAALKALNHGLDVYVKKYGEDASELIPRLSALSAQYVEMSQFEKSNEISRWALRIIERNNGADHVRAIVPHAQLADALRYQQKYPEAMHEMQEAVRIARQQLPARHPVLAGVLVRYGDLLRRMQRYDEAEQVFAEGVAMLEGAKTGEYAQMLQVYGTLAAARGEHALASERFRKSAEVFRLATGESTFTWLTNLLLVGSLGQSGHLAEAEQLAIEASHAIEGISNENSFERSFLAHTRGTLRWRQGRMVESVADLREALRILIIVYGENHPDSAGLRVALARSLLALDDADSRIEASTLIGQAMPIVEKSKAGKPDLGVALLVRAEIRLNAGDLADAKQDIAEALPLLQGKGLDLDRARRTAADLSQRAARSPLIGQSKSSAKG